jgi:hypothetical protein
MGALVESEVVAFDWDELERQFQKDAESLEN